MSNELAIGGLRRLYVVLSGSTRERALISFFRRHSLSRESLWMRMRGTLWQQKVGFASGEIGVTKVGKSLVKIRGAHLHGGFFAGTNIVGLSESKPATPNPVRPHPLRILCMSCLVTKFNYYSRFSGFNHKVADMGGLGVYSVLFTEIRHRTHCFNLYDQAHSPN